MFHGENCSCWLFLFTTNRHETCWNILLYIWWKIKKFISFRLFNHIFCNSFVYFSRFCYSRSRCSLIRYLLIYFAKCTLYTDGIVKLNDTNINIIFIINLILLPEWLINFRNQRCSMQQCNKIRFPFTKYRFVWNCMMRLKSKLPN